jgi:hypothetical protein
MKRIALLLPLLFSSLSPAFASSIPKNEISGDAKWLIHLEAAQFRSTKIGGFVTTELLEKNLSQPAQQMGTKFKLNIDVNKILSGINSITIYGTDYENPQDHSVLLLRVGPDIEKILVGFLAGFALEGTNAPLQITQTKLGNFTFYKIQDAAYCAVLPGKVIAIGRSREITENAAKVIDGKAPGLDSGKSFGGFGDMKEAFFFMGVAEGFNRGNGLPPQAKLLQVADAGRIVLGEDANQLYLSLALRGKTPESVTQMQQVMQGLIAIGSLSQPQDKDVAQLLQSIKVSADDNNVNVRVAYPVDRAIDQLMQARDQMLKHEGNEAKTNGTEPTVPQPATPAPSAPSGTPAPSGTNS